MIADWNVLFGLTASRYSADPLIINSGMGFASGDGEYRLRHDGCSLTNVVRSTTNPIPQEDGNILHRRFVAGMQMQLAIQLWANDDKIACDDLLQEMLDTLDGYLYALLNAGDNEGRIVWLPAGHSSPTSDYRMLDDIRLLSYQTGGQPPNGGPFEVTVTIDCALPYAEDLTQLSPTVTGAVVNNGNRPTYPVWQIDGGFTTMTLTLDDTGEEFSYDESQPDAPSIGGGEYLEIDTFTNRVTKVAGGTLYNAMAGVVLPSSIFFLIPPGTHNVTLTSAPSGNGLINAAWA